LFVVLFPIFKDTTAHVLEDGADDDFIISPNSYRSYFPIHRISLGYRAYFLVPTTKTKISASPKNIIMPPTISCRNNGVSVFAMLNQQRASMLKELATAPSAQSISVVFDMIYSPLIYGLKTR